MVPQNILDVMTREEVQELTGAWSRLEWIPTPSDVGMAERCVLKTGRIMLRQSFSIVATAHPLVRNQNIGLTEMD